MRGIGRTLLPDRPNCVLIIGSGALRIGQAGEFDYCGSQAIKALQQEGVRTILLNPNIATIQTSEGFADEVYFLPILPQVVEEILVKEKVDGLLLGFGGQTALNCGLELDASGALARHNVRVLGTPISTIRSTEDRRLFVERLSEIDVRCAKSHAVHTRDAGLEAARELGLPVVLRGGFSLGGEGSAIVRDVASLSEALDHALATTSQVLVEEFLGGWKELEYEVVRDAADNCVVVCAMENVDPMGIHTGDSIVVAPTQTLDDREHQMLRDVALRTIRHLGVVGECNIQFALAPGSLEYRTIEVNARLSRSSALASKATGYPLAFVAAKLALGYTLPQIPNAVTRTTTAFAEPALDYLVCKIPRWDFDKFDGVGREIGTEMKSVGEVMAIGRSFGEAFQKALRMLEIGVDGLDPAAYPFANLREELAKPTPRRPFAIARALSEGMEVQEIAKLTGIDGFFVHQMNQIVLMRQALEKQTGGPDESLLRDCKRMGFSDLAVAKACGLGEAHVREQRHRLGIRGRLAKIDTLAGEYPAETNYLYFTYSSHQSEHTSSDAPRVLVLGSGCYRIGSSVEFDWCCVSAVDAARALGFEVTLLNSNPETVSTDYDVSDRLVFDEISLETVLELCEQEKYVGVIVAMGGQTPNNLSLKLHNAGVKILGTSPTSIDRSEDRKKFSELCDQLKIDQPRWAELTALARLEHEVDALGGYPVLVRPSYVLSGAAMRVAHNEPELRSYLTRATETSQEHPVVVSKYQRHAREVEFDAVADRGEIVLWAVSEHIEDAGVHSGDATLVLPPQGLYLETINRVRSIGAKIASALQVSGPFNLQLLSRHNEVMVIECNLRASRTFPFVSKATGVNFITAATRIILGAPRQRHVVSNCLELPYVAVKAPQFSFRKMSGVDPILGVEMYSTGEAGCLGDDEGEALLKAMLATGFRYPKRGVLLSLGPVGNKYRFVEEAEELVRQGLSLYATRGTAEVLSAESVSCRPLEKDDQESPIPRATELLKTGEIDLVINIPREYDDRGRPDGFLIRRLAIDLGIPLITNMRLARKIVWAMGRYPQASLQSRPWGSYLKMLKVDRRRDA